MAGVALKRDDRLGKWIIRELVGAGGMGKVYRAFDSVLQREVALKTLEPGPVIEQSGISEAEILERFKREAQAVAKVRHPNVVEVISYDEIDGRPVIEMELLHGENLGTLGRKGPFSIDRAVDIILGVCAGVFACHRRGIVHRDLKPQNIFIAFNDELQQEFVKVLDFGVSKLAIAADITHDGRLLGTPTYMSPEQARGKTADSRSDQYSIGVLLYLCLTSRSPYGPTKGKNMFAILAAVRAGEITRLREVCPEIPERLEEVVLRAMKMLPDERFSSVQELGRELLEFASPRGRDQWNQYFTNAPVTMMLPQPSVPMTAPGSSTSAGGVPFRLTDKPSTSLPDTTVNNDEVVTAVDSRFTATTVRGEAVNAEAAAASGANVAGGEMEPDGDTKAGTQNPTQAKRRSRRIGLVAGLSLLGALVGWGVLRKAPTDVESGAQIPDRRSGPSAAPQSAVPGSAVPKVETRGAMVNPPPEVTLPPPRASVPVGGAEPVVPAAGRESSPGSKAALPPPAAPSPTASVAQERGNKASRSVERKKRKNAHRPAPGEKTPDGIPLID